MKYLILKISLLVLLFGCNKDNSVVSFEEETLPDLIITNVTIEKTIEPDSSVSCFYLITIKNIGDTLFDGIYSICVGPGDNSGFAIRGEGSYLNVNEQDSLGFGVGYNEPLYHIYKNYGAIIKINKFYTSRIPQVPEKNYENNSYFIANWLF